MKLSKAILVIRSDDEFSQILRDDGLSVINLPLVETEPLEDQAELQAVFNRITEYDGLFFTSPVSAEIFAKEARNRNCIVRSQVYAMGARANGVLRKAGIPTVFDDSLNSAEELIRAGGNEFDNKKLLFVRGDKSLLTIPDLLKDKAEVDEVIVYRTRALNPDQTISASIVAMIESCVIEWVCFFSPSAVDVFFDIFGELKTVRIAAIGNTTAGRASELGFDVRFTSPRPSSVRFADTFLSYINDQQ